MKTFVYTVRDSSRMRGYNRTIRVFRVKHNKPEFIGREEAISTASYKGDYAIACQIVSDNLGHKMSDGHGSIGRGYSLVSKNIRLFEV